MEQMTVFFFLFISCLAFAPNQLAATRSVGLIHPPGEDQNDVSVIRGPQGPHEPPKMVPAIERVCRFAKDDKLCMGSLEKDPDLVKDDAKSLAFEIIKVALSNATEISKHVKTLVTNTKFAPGVQQGMADCQQQFVDVADELDDCLNALENGKIKEVGEWLVAAVAAADTCIESLQGVEQVLLKKTETFRRLCENALAINRALAANPALKL